MRIIFLNIWHGKFWKPLEKFILDQSEKTNIFCFVEVDPAIQVRLESVLKGFTPIYEKGIKTVYLEGVIEGRAIFVKDRIDIKKGGRKNIHPAHKKDAGGFQYVELDLKGKPVFIGEVHGRARPGHKMDTKIRINQSGAILEFFKDKNGPRIIGGDFNLMPFTKSVKMFEDADYRNLIKEYSIKDTRGKINHALYKGDQIQYHSDYCFVSPDIKVKSFEVPDVEISDHLPLILDFEV